MPNFYNDGVRFQMKYMYVWLALVDEQYMWDAFNQEVMAHFSDMHGDNKRKQKKAKWMGDAYWRSLQYHWQTRGCPYRIRGIENW